jgi:RNA polymerase sigma-70 factor (ECF subfamily)
MTDVITTSVTEFAHLRPRLFGIAYRMLSDVADAEDAVQEAFLRREQVRARGESIVTPEGWLVSVVSRLCIDQLRSARARREEYLGEWLPEPLVAADGPDGQEAVEMTESLSLAFLLMLERLSPEERAVFLLHDVFGYPYAEIAPIVGKSEAACRQLAKRARERIQRGRPRRRVPREEAERMAAEFLRASVEGDLSALMALLTDDVELVADGGGRAATDKPISGADAVARFLISAVQLGPPGWTASPATVNGGPGLVARDADGRPYAVLALEPAGRRIAAVRVVVNPDKLHGVPDGAPGTERFRP